MNNTSYYVTKSKKKKETRYLELEKLSGYQVTPKTHEKDMIGVSKIIFVNDDMAEKIIRKKVERKIAHLLDQLRLFNEDDGNSGSVKRTLMDAEKLRLQLINNYIKYLGNTYHSLTLQKIDLIIERLKLKLYQMEFKKQPIYDNIILEEEPKKEGRRGR